MIINIMYFQLVDWSSGYFGTFGSENKFLFQFLDIFIKVG
jgi:hypothetical protein